MNYLFAPPPVISSAIVDSDARFPVHRIYCVGRNYAAHIREMGLDPEREPPFFFAKPIDALVNPGAKIPYPRETADFHYEIELVIAISKGGRAIAVKDALSHVFGYAVGIDLTRRDTQVAARKAGRPWDHGKGFDQSAPMSNIVPASKIGHPSSGRIWLAVNNAVRQESDISKLIWSVPETIAALSNGWDLEPGDLIFSGTPDGIGPVVPGDIITGGIDGLAELRFEIV